uniref:Methylthioribose-1-phosphate isomerase n=1 Tax=Eubacterium cellulosolvens (strain ATCC 43171 / JCM 9499 / 6) TaxID=633697 RepID=I5ATI0_EUBC6
MSEKISIMDIDTVSLDDENSQIVIIDQTLLPYETKTIRLTSQKQIWEAIYKLQVRGAPAIGVCAGFGLYLAAKEIAAGTQDYDEFYEAFVKAKDYLDSSRPTAVNLSWALNQLDRVVCANKGKSVPEVLEALHKEAMRIQEEDIRACYKLGEYGLSLLKKGDGLLTHCNAGKLAATRYGMATAPMYLGQEKGYNFHVYCDETRPVLQGARLTAKELMDSGIDTTVICDNMSSSLMKEGKVQAVFVGCDRVAANGDTANKIGTSGVAIIAKHYGVPMYIMAPTSTIDMNTATGADIKIEQRAAEEVTEMWYEKRMAPEGVKVYNPSFDVTDNSLITAIVTEYGIARPPFTESLKKIMEIKAEAMKQE